MSAFSFIQITDHHLPEDMSGMVKGFSPGYALRTVLRHIANHTASQADFLLSTGDLVEPATATAYRSLCQMLSLQPAAHTPGPASVTIEGLQDYPFFCIPGNHDDRKLFLQHLYPAAGRSDLVNAAFQHEGVQFICLDMGASAKAKLYPETLDFLAQSLNTELTAIIVTHHHVTPIGSRWLDEFIADDIRDFWDLLESSAVRGRILGVISGHVHISYETAVAGIPVYGLRSTAFPFARQDEPLLTLLPPQYRLFTLQDGRLTTQIIEVPL